MKCTVINVTKASRQKKVNIIVKVLSVTDFFEIQTLITNMFELMNAAEWYVSLVIFIMIKASTL